MLVLGRKVDEAIFLSGGIKITVIEAARGRVRLGIEAPQNVKVWRNEFIPKDGSPPTDPHPTATPTTGV